MKKIALALLLFIVAFLVFLVATIPASFALSFLPQPSPIQAVGVSGTVWNGRARSVLQDNHDLGSLQWSLHPVSLLGLRLSADFTLTQSRLQADGEVTLYRDQTILLENTHVRGDVSQLPLPEDMMLVTPAGLFQADIAEALLDSETVKNAQGKVLWKPARITAPSSYELGEISMDVTGKDGNLTGKLGSKNSPLNLSGTLQLTANGDLSTNVKLAPHGQTPQEIRDLLPMAGRQAADGSVTIKQRMKLR